MLRYGPRKNSAAAVQGRLEGSAQNVCYLGHMSSGNSNKKVSKSCSHLNQTLTKKQERFKKAGDDQLKLIKKEGGICCILDSNIQTCWLCSLPPRESEIFAYRTVSTLRSLRLQGKNVSLLKNHYTFGQESAVIGSSILRLIVQMENVMLLIALD